MTQDNKRQLCVYCKSNPALKTVLDVFFNSACRSCKKVSFVLNGGFGK